MDIRKMVPWSGLGRERMAGPRETLRGFEEPLGSLIERALAPAAPDAPRAEILETPTEIVVTSSLPGFKRDEVSVEATENALVLRGGAARGRETRRHGLLSRRREVRTFTRRIPLPAAVNPDEAKASFKEGTLEVRLPRVKEVVVRRIEII